MAQRYRRRVKSTPQKGHARILSSDDTEKKKIKQQIAKKQYEIELLRIELEHPPKQNSEKPKIGFCTN